MSHKLALSIALALGCQAVPALAGEDLEALRKQIEQLRQDYEQRIQALEQRLAVAEERATAPVQAANAPTAAPATGNNAFNPAIGVILEGRYAAFQNDPQAYYLPGFPSVGESGPGEEGLSLGHSELLFSANVDDKFSGQMTAALHAHDGSTEIELEEAFIQTLGLGHGLTVKAGRFFSGLGYLNAQHPHAWDFADAPLIYRGLFGDQYNDDGLQLTWLAPIDQYVQLGAELLRGGRFPATAADGVGASTLFAKTGGDLGDSHSWQAGVSYWAADAKERSGAGHTHGGEGPLEIPAFSGDSRIVGLDFVWKWAPRGNPKAHNAKFQFEYFERREDGEVAMLGSGPPETTGYEGTQRGFYAQSVYQFMPGWRIGARYDWLNADNRADDAALLAEAGLDGEGHRPTRYSLMLDWSNSEFSRIRLQFNRDNSTPDSDNQVFLQYIHSLGAHGAHQF